MSNDLSIAGVWFEASPALNEIAAALAKAQAAMQNPVADQDNPYFKSKYADLAQVLDVCKGPLNSNGIAIWQGMVSAGGVPGVRTMLLHVSGQWIANTCFCEPKDKGPQAMGSVNTYLRRYGLAGVVGIAQADDDAEAGQPRAPKPKREAPAPLPAPVAVVNTERNTLMTEARGIIGQALHWDVRKAGEWISSHVNGKRKLADLDMAELRTVLDQLRILAGTKPAVLDGSPAGAA